MVGIWTILGPTMKAAAIDYTCRRLQQLASRCRGRPGFEALEKAATSGLSEVDFHLSKGGLSLGWRTAIVGFLRDNQGGFDSQFGIRFLKLA
jgi:hypothetical protein